MSEKELLNAILKRFPRIAEAVKQKPRVSRKVVRLALREPRTVVALIEQFGYTDRLILAAFRCWPELTAVAETDEAAATILSDLQRALESVPSPGRSLLFTGDKRSPRVRVALKRIREALGEGV